MKTQNNMNATHTPGPWIVIKRLNTDGTTWIQGPAYDENGWREVCSLPSWPSRNEAIIEANARLIAAAPEMLEALERQLENTEGDIEAHRQNEESERDLAFLVERCDNIRAVIARAKGVQS